MCTYLPKFFIPLVFVCVLFSLVAPGKSVSVPEELVVYGHSRTPSYASQQSKISGTKHRDTCLFPSNKSNIATTPITQIKRITSVFVFFSLLCCRLQLEPLQFNRSQPSTERIRRFCLHRYRQHPGTQRSAGGESREGEQDYSHCNLSPCN